MNTDLHLERLSLNGPTGGKALPLPSVLALLPRVIGKGFRAVWAGYVRNLDRAGGLPLGL